MGAVRARAAALRERIKALHSYSVPEIVVLPVDVASSNPAYVEWVRGAKPFGEPK